MSEPVTSRKRYWSWLLWWEVDPSELDAQVANYERLSILKSARGQSALCFVFSVILTALLASVGILAPNAYVDMVLMAALAVFIYFGHRWAMIAGMILWTAEKGLMFAFGLHSLARGGITQIIWWCVYMHAFYFAFRVEQARRARLPAAAAT